MVWALWFPLGVDKSYMETDPVMLPQVHLLAYLLQSSHCAQVGAELVEGKDKEAPVIWGCDLNGKPASQLLSTRGQGPS